MEGSRREEKILIIGWLVTIFFLFFYCFTQIDLGLTLTRACWWQTVQKAFQQIGYFRRPLSASFYLLLLFFLFSFYFLLLSKIRKGKFSSKKVWVLVILTAGILWFSYNAFSYDLFNYIFDARVVTHYRQNPYQYKALDFPDDPMLGFMHWTHRLYPYGPLWLVFTIPLSLLGLHKLVPTMILFKSLGVIGYLFSCFFIYKILEKLAPKEKLLGLAVFALSPLVIIEGLVSAHNDILMMALSLAGFWFLVKRKYFFSWSFLFLSIGVKFATVLLLPAFGLLTFFFWQKKKIDWDRIWLLSFFLMVAAVFLAAKRTELQPWYLLYLFPFVALLPKKRIIFWPLFSLSLGTLLHYAPFLYLGNWDPPVPEIKLKLTFWFLSLGILVGLFEIARGKGFKYTKRR